MGGMCPMWQAVSTELIADDDRRASRRSWIEPTQVTNMYGMLCLCPNFNKDISRWNISAVRHISEFLSASGHFDHDLSHWDLSAVISAEDAFPDSLAVERRPAIPPAAAHLDAFTFPGIS